jgi:hypothetical protein
MSAHDDATIMLIITLKWVKTLKKGNLHADAAPELLGGAPLLPEPDILQNPMRFSKNFRNE